MILPTGTDEEGTVQFQRNYQIKRSYGLAAIFVQRSQQDLKDMQYQPATAAAAGLFSHALSFIINETHFTL
jgi:hypothetical protein